MLCSPGASRVAFSAFLSRNGTNRRRYKTMANMLVSCSHGGEDPERATLSFIFGNVAAAADQPTAVLLTIEGVWLATKGYAEDIHKEGFQPLKEVLQAFVGNGGQV